MKPEFKDLLREAIAKVVSSGSAVYFPKTTGKLEVEQGKTSSYAPKMRLDGERLPGVGQQVVRMGNSYVCDFCCVGAPSREYYAPDYEMSEQTYALFELVSRTTGVAVPTRLSSVGNWRCCDGCATLVDAEDWRGLARLVLGKTEREEREWLDEVVDPLVSHFAEFARHARRDRGGKLAWDRYEQKKRVEPVLVRAQNVRDYVVAHPDDFNDIRQFVCVKPPYQEMVITYDHEFQDRSGKVFSRHTDLVVRELAASELASAVTPSAAKEYDPRLSASDCAEIRALLERAAPASLVEVRVYADTMPWPGRWYAMVDERGAVITVGDDGGYLYVRDPDETRMIAAIPEWRGLSGEEVVTQATARHGFIALATLQFMNCKNVDVVDNRPTRQQRRAAERAGKKPPVTYKTLVIHPFGKKRRVGGAGAAVAAQGGSISLHICRGHFKSYLGGGGLGKYHRHGVWWWSPQVRGKSEAGRVYKDYDVKP